MVGDQSENIREAAIAVADLDAYFRSLTAHLRRSPRNGLIRLLITADDDGKFLTEHELISTCALLLIAGHETTTHTIGNGLVALLRHTDQLALLRSDPALISSATEEIIRYEAATGVIGRIAMEDLDVGGEAVPAGSLVFGVAQAANRDPAAFVDSDRFDITRQGTRQLTLGHGIHVCLGAALARLETEVAVGTLVKAFPNLAPKTDEYEWIPSIALRGVQALPVTL